MGSQWAWESIRVKSGLQNCLVPGRMHSCKHVHVDTPGEHGPHTGLNRAQSPKGSQSCGKARWFLCPAVLSPPMAVESEVALTLRLGGVTNLSLEYRKMTGSSFP